jgi:hypothetical protein
MNKEDIWVASIPAPLKDAVIGDVNDNFQGDQLRQWNIYSPLWAPVAVGTEAGGKKALLLRDADPYDFAKAERVFPATGHLQVDLGVAAAQADHGRLEIELQDERNTPAMRLSFEPDGTVIVKAGARTKKVMSYTSGVEYDLRLTLDAEKRMYTVSVGGKDLFTQLLFAPVHRFGHIVFRTGEARHFPTADSPPEAVGDLPHAGERVQEAKYSIFYLKTKTL